MAIPTVDHLADAAASWPGRPGLIERDRTWTWAQLDAAANSVSATLGGMGIEPGEPVLLLTANDGVSVAAFHGAVRIGATVVLVPLTSGRAEYDDVVDRVAPRLVIGPRARAAQLAETGPSWLDTTEATVRTDDEGRDATAVDAARVVLFTSGTTARAKGVVHTVESLDAAAGNFLEAADLGADDRFFLVSPLSSITGVLQALFMAPRAGACVVVEAHWDDVATTDLLLETGATFYGGPDVIVARLLAELERRQVGSLPLQSVALGGTMLDPDLLRRVEDGGVSVLRAYGSSEVPFSTVTPRHAGRQERLTRDGRPVPGAEIRVGSGRDAQEICIRGPHMLVGFLDQEDALEAIVDGWYLTGDLGSMEDGSLKVEGRIKEIVIRNGVKVSMHEVERAVASLPGVEAAVTYRVDDPDTGEHLGVAVRLDGRRHFDGVVLVEQLRDTGLATVKLPEELIEWSGPFPETPSGKIIRDEVGAAALMPRWYNDRLRARAETHPAPVWDTDDPERFRASVVSWLEAHAPAKGSAEDFSATHLTAPTSAEDFIEHELALFERAKRWQRTLHEAGLASMSWPREHGGQGCPTWCDAIVAEEQNHYGVSTRVLSVGLHMMSAVLRTHGSSAQRDRYLSPIARGEEVWCQLFSEPDAGSDLPNIKSAATPTDRGWRVNGQKVWNSGAVASDLGAAIVRTEPGSRGRHGLSLMVIDMHAPGVEVRPLRQMSGGYHFSEVFLTDVEVPDDALIGTPGGGWDVARLILQHERSAIGGGTSARSAVQLAALAGDLEQRSDPIVRQALAAAHTRERLLDLLLQRLSDGASVPAGGSIVKLLYSEHARLSADAALALLGPQGGLRLGEPGAVDVATPWIERFLFAPGLRIGGGTDEIQRNQIAEAGLGLPREPRPA